MGAERAQQVWQVPTGRASVEGALASPGDDREIAADIARNLPNPLRAQSCGGVVEVLRIAFWRSSRHLLNWNGKKNQEMLPIGAEPRAITLAALACLPESGVSWVAQYPNRFVL